ncbi:MAG: response regulator, partial [Deltaproteobacteria bacterium]|nr:response regulator [Deltaproteobacteria bacterium]
METLIVVIIEDEEAHFSLMKRAIVREFSYASVVHFQDAITCLDQLDQINPTVIITDYLMPGINGTELLEMLKQQDIDTPVIMITGQGSESIAIRAMKLGAWDYLVKTPKFFTLLPSIIEKVVSERKLKNTLDETQRRFRDLAESTSDWIWEMDVKGKYIYSNPMVESMLGYRFDEMLGKYFYDFFSEKERETSAHTLLQAMAAGKPISGIDNCYIHKEGCVVVLEAKGVPFFDKAGNLRGYRGISRDVSARKLAEERIHSLSRQLMKVQEAERQRLSHELHDLVGQDLSALKMGLDTLFNDQTEAFLAKRQRVAKLSEIAHGTIMAVRDLAYALRPNDLDHLGLAKTVFRHCEDFSAKTGVKVDFFAAGMEYLRLDSDIEIVLYRLIQEGLNNVKNHADATDATIRLVASFPNIILRIEDNGKG